MDMDGHTHGMHDASGGWLALTSWDAAALVALLALLAVYCLLAWRTRHEAGGFNRGAALALALGLTAVLLAASSPLISLVREGNGSHLAFMTQLELLIAVAPPLLLLGARRILPARLSLVSVPPALTLAIWVLTVYAWHIPSLHMLGMMEGWASYTLMLASFVAAGLVFWWPVIGPVRSATRGMRAGNKLVYLALAQAAMSLLAAVLIWYPSLIYGHGPTTQPFGLSGIVDQRLSGIVMMVTDMTVASTVAGWIVLRTLANAEPREQVTARTDPAAGDAL